MLFYSGATVDRFDMWSGEMRQLRFDMDSADLSALQAGAPVLDGHQVAETEYVIGVVESARKADDGFRATLRFSNREDVNGLWQDIEDGILRNVSMGVQIGELVLESRPGAEVKQYLARKWKPYEISVVPIGADPNAKILSTSLTAAPGADQQRAQYELALRQRRWRVLGNRGK
ncbi:MAG: hypothetical protein EBR82_56410 [Caulobacteraceae bacterium]|nr:hypothetical protein [Caulobacteraceae bacterium]